MRGGVGGGVVRRAGSLVATDDLAQRPASLGGGAAVGKVHPVRKITVLVVAFPDRAVVEVSVVGLAAAGECDVGQVAAGGISEHGVGGVGGDALCGVHGDRVSELHMLTQIVTAEHGPRLVTVSAGCDAGMLGGVIDGDDLPALPVAHGRPGQDAGAVIRGGDGEGGIVAAGDDDVADGDVVTARPGYCRRLVEPLAGAFGDSVVVDPAVQRVGDLDGVGQQQALLPAARSAW